MYPPPANSPQQVDASGGVLRFFGRRKSASELLDIVADKLCSIKFSQKSLLQADVPVIRWGEAAPGHATDRLHVVDFQNRLEGQPIIGEPGSQTLMRAEEAKVGWRGLVVMVKWWGTRIMLIMEPLEVAYYIYVCVYTPIYICIRPYLMEPIEVAYNMYICTWINMYMCV